MSSDNDRMRFHMGCGERLQSRRWIVRCVSGVLPGSEIKSGANIAGREQPRREEDRDES
ncbi:hypothetical protein DFR30_0545 [Thiogranum longum]|uniref:Uncharacterized protein n=1 Tax=Thiogranum longum TaxID=1537524 RepID=A0A4R1H6E3_9GAMM|nr:hypothetical protein [Thiogranum longum]TCK17317.1 hypothetical protein DFR30_0545 [Thiogranum longum]